MGLHRLTPPTDRTQSPMEHAPTWLTYGFLYLTAAVLSVPIAKGPRGLPMGTQVIGAYGDDLRTLQVAAFVERVAAHTRA